MTWRYDSAAVSVWVDKKRCCWWQPEVAVQHLNTYYKCKNNYEDNLAIQNEIFKIYDFDFGGEQVEAMFA